MAKVYTKTGDKGETGLIGNTRVLKNSVRITSYGDLDELNSYIGLCRSLLIKYPQLQTDLKQIQNKIFSIGSLIACDQEEYLSALSKITENDIQFIELKIDQMDEKLPPLKNFILPGATELSSYLHIARSICRRSERSIIPILKEIDANIIIYINRLSDYFFTLARYYNHCEGVEESIWKS